LPSGRFVSLPTGTYTDVLAPGGTSSAFIYEASTRRLLFDSNGTGVGGFSTVATLDATASIVLGDIALI
jgi:hypothetical protein